MGDTEDLIDRLTEQLAPRRTMSPWVACGMAAAAALLTTMVLVGLFGMRADFADGHPQPVPLISALVMLCAGIVVVMALAVMARPAVGTQRVGWQGAVTALAVLPIAALLTAMGNAAQREAMMPPDGPFCLATGMLASLASIVLLTLWLRRGAPTSAQRASWLIGFAGGAIGALAIAFVCPIDAITHIGTWHVGIIIVAAAGSRLLLPRFLRW